MRKTVSIQDIAQAAGVSHTTVSRALKDNPLISAEAREHIQQLAREMGYIPNAVAQSLRGQRTGTIGVVVTTMGDPFFQPGGARHRGSGPPRGSFDFPEYLQP